MQVALEETKVSLREGNKGFGAVLVRNGEVIAKAHDTVATEELIRKINPRLSFGRNYQKLRPRTDYCEETITLRE